MISVGFWVFRRELNKWSFNFGWFVNLEKQSASTHMNAYILWSVRKYVHQNAGICRYRDM